MPTPPDRLAAIQKRFSDHIRDPDRNPAPDGIEDRRLAIYRRLFFNNLSSLFSRNFPKVRESVDDGRWKALIRGFMAEHRATTPLFPELGREFIRYLAERTEQDPDCEWMAELAQWQFMATSARNDESEPAAVAADPQGDPVAGRPVLNPTLRIAHFRWPVHRIDPAHAPGEPAATMLAIHRKRDDSLGRMELNAVTARLLELLAEQSTASGRAALEALATEMQHPDPERLVDQGRALLSSLIEREVLLGVEPG
ncbi:MAG: putative DNA-binding domain-containing protein [Wenzhouxiangellaceae bacterium]|nr:putative DNA-binding domain-containing protein [Wenzhouxiangellaceae bacterium]